MSIGAATVKNIMEVSEKNKTKQNKNKNKTQKTKTKN